jgi:hypothetical protein
VGLVLICTGCSVLEWLGGVTHQRLESPEMRPYLQAAQQSKRVERGFTSLPENGPVRVEVPRWKRHYDVMLHIDRGNLSRTIAFIVRDGQPSWSGEQEIHHGPREYTNVDGTHREYLVVSYSTVKGSGTPEGGYVDYRGPDVDLEMRATQRRLSADDARRIWETWHK